MHILPCVTGPTYWADRVSQCIELELELAPTGQRLLLMIVANDFSAVWTHWHHTKYHVRTTRSQRQL